MQARIVVPGVIGAALVAVAAAWWLRGPADADRSPTERTAVPPPNGPASPAEAASSIFGREEPTAIEADVPAAAPRARTAGAGPAGVASADSRPTATRAVPTVPSARVPAESVARASLESPDSEPALRPQRWMLGSRGCPGYTLRSDGATVWEGAWSARLVGEEGVDHLGFCPVLQVVSAAPFAGRRIEFVVHLRTDDVPVYATSWLRADDRSGLSVAFDNALPPGLPPSRLESPWIRRSIVLDVPATAVVLTLGTYLKGPGTLWMDSASLRVVDPSTPLTRPRRPIVESSTPPLDPETFPATLQNGGFEDVTEVVPAKS